MVSFDLGNGVFSTTLLPLGRHDSFDSNPLERSLVLLNESVAMFSKYTEMSFFHISIFGEFDISE